MRIRLNIVRVYLAPEGTLRMFGWISKTTELESFCETGKVETAAVQFEGNESEDGLRRALAILLIYTGFHFWQSIRESHQLKKYTKNISANVVIFEALVYAWNYIATEMERCLEEAGLDDDGPIFEAVTDSLHISISIIEKYWPELSPQEALKGRLYLPDPVKAMEKFNRLLLSSYKNELPVLPGKENEELNADLLMQLPLFLVHVGTYSKTFLPGIAETTRRMAETVVQSRE